MEGVRFLPYIQQELGFAGVTPSVFINVGVFVQPARNVLVQNFTNEFLQFSWDGISNHFVLPPCSDWAIDVATNKGTAQSAAIPIGFGLWVAPRDTLPTSGSVILSYFYFS